MSSVANTFVYELPENLSDGFCFNGGRPIAFLNVDWFHVPDTMTAEELAALLRGKRYVKPGKTYLVLGPLTFTLKAEVSA